MHEFEVDKEIRGSIDTIWSIIDNFSDTWVYHPIVERSACVNGTRSGLGAQRECQMYDGGTVQERITAYDATERSYTMEVVEIGPFPLNRMVVTVKAEAGRDPNHTRVTYSGGFAPKFGPMGWLMAKTMMLGQFKKMMGQLIDGLEQHALTGRVVGKDGDLETFTPAEAA